MNSIFIIAFIVLVFVIIIIASILIKISTYNDLVKSKNRVKNSWANIEVQLQRRFDLIPNLVETIKAFTKHEKDLIEAVTINRDNFLNAHDQTEKISLNKELTANLKSLSVISESYPELKTDAKFLKLQEELTEIEEDITYARQFYNDAVTIYNNKLMSFPANKIAKKNGFVEEKLFDAIEEANVAPVLDFKTRIKLKDMKCPNCGSAVGENDTSCEYCGTSFVE